MKICEVCEKSVETVFVSAYGEWLICKPCLISERFAIMRSEGEFASQADYPKHIPILEYMACRLHIPKIWRGSDRAACG